MKVFLSHASADKPTIRMIRERLEAAGIGVWIDEADIRVGESIPARVAEGLSQSSILLLAVSAASLSSPWVERELNSFFMQAMRDGKPILPCLLDDVQPPTLISDLKYADFRTSFDRGVQDLLLGVGLAEEIELNRRALEIKQQLTNQLRPIDRRSCHTTFVAGPGFKLNLFRRMDPEVWEIMNLLGKSGLIQDTPDGEDGTLRATALGVRVMSDWDEL